MTPEHIRAAFALQASACADLGSPFMGGLMQLFATRDWPDCAVTRRIFNLLGDISPGGQSVPLRLAGALHALHLQGQPVLGAVYPPADVPDDALWQAVCTVLLAEGATIDTWLDRAPQTNEVRRSAVLIAVGHLLAERYRCPMRLSELGASAGLNLQWDRYGLRIKRQNFGAPDPVLTLTPDWIGALPPVTPPQVVARGGVDLAPLDPAADALRLQAYLWPDQPDRLALTRAAIAAAATVVDQGDAADWLASRMDHRPGQLHLIYTTVAWQYFPAAKQAVCEAIIMAAGANATPDTPLAWFGMENDGGPCGAALTLRLWPGDLTLHLGRADFHGRWIEWGA